MLHALRRDSELALIVLTVVLVGYGLLAYFLLPLTWRHYEHQKGLAGLDMVTRTGDDIPGDPINVGAVGSKEDVLCAMNAAHPNRPRKLTRRFWRTSSTGLKKTD